MTETNYGSIPLLKCFSMDRDDMSANDINLYPDSYSDFQSRIENVFFKSELLFKCKIEFDRLVKIEISETKQDTEITHNDLILSLIFTGAIKSGRSSIINMILNSKIMPVNVIGSSCCVKLSHPKSSSKQISVTTCDWDGWEIDKITDVEIEDLPKKIEETQHKILRSSMGQGRKLARRLNVQIPHRLLKNIDIYKCSPIDGIYSFDEPFDIIEKTKNTIMMHVIDATNGLMEWDRTFLSKIQYKYPQLPIFFIINHVDVQYEILLRDKCIRFGTTPDKANGEYMESESDQASNDETMSEKYPFNEQSIINQQNNLIEKSKKQLIKLGFALGKGLTISDSSLSVKEFFKLIDKKEKEADYHWNLINVFFSKLNFYLEAWMEKMLITSSLQLKCQINGVVDAFLCHINYPSALSQDISSDIYMQTIKKTDKHITDSFTTAISNLQKHTLKTVKDKLKHKEKEIFAPLPALSTEDPTEILHIIKPILIKNCEQILFNKLEFDINIEIHKIILNEISLLETTFGKIRKSKSKSIHFVKYIYNLFIVLKKTFHWPLLISIPEEIFYGNTKWYKDILRLAARRIRGTSYKSRDTIVQEMINDMTAEPLIKTAVVALENIHKDIQFFTKKYQETYKIARGWSIESNRKELFGKLVMVDFIIEVIENSFQEMPMKFRSYDMQKLPLFYNEFYELNDDKYIYKRINIQSFTSLSTAINSLCFKRIFSSNLNILCHRFNVLLPDGVCVISYSKMHCDLYTAISEKTKWSINSINNIITTLVQAINCLLPVYNYIQIDLLPENILLLKDSSDVYTCRLFPYVESSTSLNYNIRSDTYRKFSKVLFGVSFQLGMVLSWIITNDINICSEIYEKQFSTILEENFLHNLRNKMLIELKPFRLAEICIKLLFHPDQYDLTETLLRDLKVLQDDEKNTDSKECDNTIV